VASEAAIRLGSASLSETPPAKVSPGARESEECVTDRLEAPGRHGENHHNCILRSVRLWMGLRAVMANE